MLSLTFRKMLLCVRMDCMFVYFWWMVEICNNTMTTYLKENTKKISWPSTKEMDKSQWCSVNWILINKRESKIKSCTFYQSLVSSSLLLLVLSYSKENERVNGSRPVNQLLKILRQNNTFSISPWFLNRFVICSDTKRRLKLLVTLFSYITRWTKWSL